MDTLGEKMNQISDDYFFNTNLEEEKENKVYVLIIYDIVDNKRRTKLSKFLQGYGFRIQKSAFEAMINIKLYSKLLKEISIFATNEDSIRIYKIIGKGQVTCYGKQEGIESNDVIII